MEGIGVFKKLRHAHTTMYVIDAAPMNADVVVAVDGRDAGAAQKRELKKVEIP